MVETSRIRLSDGPYIHTPEATPPKASEPQEGHSIFLATPERDHNFLCGRKRFRKDSICKDKVPPHILESESVSEPPRQISKIHALLVASDEEEHRKMHLLEEEQTDI